MICVPEIRLGHDSSDEIKNHPFFEGVDWDDIREKLTPPFKPNVSTFFLAGNFLRIFVDLFIFIAHGTRRYILF